MPSHEVTSGNSVLSMDIEATPTDMPCNELTQDPESLLDLVFSGEANEASGDQGEDEVWMNETDPLAIARSPSPTETSGSDTSSNESIKHSVSRSINKIQELQRHVLGSATSPIQWPLAIGTPVRHSHDRFLAAHDKWFVRATLLMVGFLHTKHHVSFRACGILLWCLASIFILLGHLESHDRMPITLGTAFSHLGLTDRFKLLLVCPKCREVFHCPVTIPKSRDEAFCRACNAPLYSGLAEPNFNTFEPQAILPRSVKPKIVVPFASLKDLLGELLLRPGMEDIIDSWRSTTQLVGKYGAIWDGEIWKTIMGADGLPFFVERQDNELRVAATIGLDW